MENTELNWHEAQRRQSELTALSGAYDVNRGVAVIAMLWMASGGVGNNAQPGPLIALFVFCAPAAFEALAPVTGAFQHLGSHRLRPAHHGDCGAGSGGEVHRRANGHA